VNRHLRSIPNSTAEDLAAQDSSLDVQCPRCGADRDAYCRNTELGTPMRASHWQRTKAATATTEGAS
jgi:predicted RNA-binding Zn-ribbon protein involved in translation (DUF1610 family)